MRKRVHVTPGHDLYTPQQTDDGPEISKLTTERTTLLKPPMEREQAELTTTGQKREKQEPTKNGQGRPTLQKLQKQQHTRTNTSQMMSLNSMRQERQKAFQRHSSQQRRSDLNMNSHTYHTGAGALYVFGQKADLTTAQSNTTKHR